MTPLLLIALGGAAGGVLRFWLAELVARRLGDAFPWGTLAVNVSGALAIGLVAAAVQSAGFPARQIDNLWFALVVGVLGSYTTVSSFSVQTLALMQGGEWLRAALNVAGSLALCLAAVLAGYVSGRVLFAG